MNVTVSFTDKAEYLLVKSVDTVSTVEDIVDHAKGIFTEAVKYSQKKLLVDLKEVTRPNKPFYYYEAIQRMLIELPISIRSFVTALVVPEEYKDLGQFIETTALNRGLQFRVLVSEQEAHDWPVSR
jgi:hypothetical protein